jgi:hypothetical protein
VETIAVLSGPPLPKDMGFVMIGPYLFHHFGRIEPSWVKRGDLLRADEKNNHGPSKEEDEKNEKLFYQFGVHMTSL